MIHRRVIGSILTLAFLAGAVFAPLPRAACALSRAKAAPPCTSCSGADEGNGTSLSIDRSCCAAPSLSERDPATVATIGESRAPEHAAVLPGAMIASRAASVGVSDAAGTGPPPAAPTQLRTTILLI